MNQTLTPEEKQFFQALLWEEHHSRSGPAHALALEHQLSIPRAFEPAARLCPDLDQGEVIVRLVQGPCPPVNWPWPGRPGSGVLKLLWDRLVRPDREEERQADVQRHLV
jgi:hypothetical protein